VPDGTDQSLDRKPLGAQRPFELDRKRILGRKLVSGGERIAERHNFDGPLRRARHAHRPDHRRERKYKGGRMTLDGTGMHPI
jgi:hypothetical protein